MLSLIAEKEKKNYIYICVCMYVCIAIACNTYPNKLFYNIIFFM